MYLYLRNVSVDRNHLSDFLLTGYSDRGRNILGLAQLGGNKTRDDLGNHFTIISYGNGPGYNKAQRENLTEELFGKS